MLNNLMSRWRAVGAFMVIAVIQSGCAATSPVSNREIAPSFSGQLENILVVSVGEDRSQSLNFKNLIVARIQRSNAEAVAATALLGTSVVPDDAAIIKVAQEANADGVLVTPLKSIDSSRIITPRQIITTSRPGSIYLDSYHSYGFW